MRGTIEFKTQIPAPEQKRVRQRRKRLHGGLVLLGAFLVAGIYLKVLAAPSLVPEPSALTFAAQPVGISGEPQQVRLMNSGRIPLRVQELVVMGEKPENFKLLNDTCEGQIISPGDSCLVRVSMRPLTDGPLSAQLEFIDDGTHSPQYVSLHGMGSGGTDLQVLPTYVRFGDEWVGEESSAQQVTISNIGTTAISMRSIAWAAQVEDFRKDNSCDTVALKPNEKCTFSVAFIPRDSGRRSALLIFGNSTRNDAYEVEVEGTGLVRVPLGKWEPSRLDFGREEEGGKGNVQKATLTNAGTGELHLAQGSLGGSHADDFTILTDECSARVLSPRDSCSVQIRFTPRDQGNRTASVNFGTNTPGREVSLPLTGTVVQTLKPAIVLAPPQLNFGRVERGRKGGPLPVEVISVGSSPLHVDRLQIVGTDQQSFAIVQDNCRGADLPVKAQCEIRIVFSPKARIFFPNRTPKSESATLMVYDNAANGRHDVTLSAESYWRQPMQSPLNANPEALDFRSETVGRQSAPQIVTLLNPGGAGVSLGQPKVVDDSFAGALLGANRGNFQIVGDECQGITLAPQAQCRIRVAFQPLGSGTMRANLLVSDTSGAERSISLSGQGLEPGGWCCEGGNVKQLSLLNAIECKRRGGTFYTDESKAKRECISQVGGMVLPRTESTTRTATTNSPGVQ